MQSETVVLCYTRCSSYKKALKKDHKYIKDNKMTAIYFVVITRKKKNKKQNKVNIPKNTERIIPKGFHI